MSLKNDDFDPDDLLPDDYTLRALHDEMIDGPYPSIDDGNWDDAQMNKQLQFLKPVQYIVLTCCVVTTFLARLQ
eukprot:7257-Eustigmatos_ZCMA.PRE.1